jgi:hypothetical protein
MGEWLEVIGQIDRQDQSNPFRQEREAGLVQVGRKGFYNEAAKKAYDRELLEAARFTEQVLFGRRPFYHFQEALSTSDFPILFGDILDRQTLARYREWPINLGGLVQERRTGSMIRSTKLFPQQYGADAKLDPVDELTEYPGTTVTEQSPILIAPPIKYGRRFGLSWEAMQDDAVDQIRDIPQAFATAARRTEEDAVLSMFLGTSGPNATLFNNTNKNVVNTTNGAVTNNPALSLPGLQDAFTVLSKMVDEQGYPILIEMVDLIVPPALEVIANNILNSATVELTTDGGDTNRRIIAKNWMQGRVRLTINPYIPQRATVANGNTSWFLFARPDAAPNGRAAMYINRLRGNEEPAIFVKEPNARRVGGGANPLDGSFENDSIEWKVRHILSSGLLDPKYAVASNGSGT